MQIPGGYFADKYGRKWLIAIMTFVAVFSRLFYIFAPTWEWILVCAFLVDVTNIYGARALVGFLVAALMRLRLKDTVEKPDKLNMREVAATIPFSKRELRRLAPPTTHRFRLFRQGAGEGRGLDEPALREVLGQLPYAWEDCVWPRCLYLLPPLRPS